MNRNLGAKLRRCACVFAALSTFCVFAFASDEANDRPARIGFVDTTYLLDQAPQALEAALRLETEFAPKQAKLDEQRAELAELAARLSNSSLELDEAELSQLERETRGLERRIKRNEQDWREELNFQKNDEFRKVRIVVLEAVGRFGREQDYDLIVSDGVLFANQRVDVTERILEYLRQENSKLKSARKTSSTSAN